VSTILKTGVAARGTNTRFFRFVMIASLAPGRSALTFAVATVASGSVAQGPPEVS
jgi:hypothetical protein